MGLLNGITEAAKFFMGASDKGKGKKALCIVGGIGTVVGAVVLGWKIWRDCKEEKKENDKRETNQLKEKEKRKTTHLAEEEKRETIRVAEEEKRETARQRAEIRQREKAEKQTKTDPGLEDWLQGYKQTHQKSVGEAPKMRNLIFPWMTEGYDIGLLAPTDCGKTTFVLQVAMALTKGACDYPISPQEDTIKPIRTLVFSLEQSNVDINTYYGDVLVRQRLLTIRGGEWFGGNPTAQILEEIQQEMMAVPGGEGIVVIIDNFTKLVDISSYAQVEQFCKILDRMRHASIEAGNPLTVLKVFHTNKDCRTDRRFTEKSFRGDSKFLYATQNVLYLTYCKGGDDKRILGFIKWKNGNKRQLWILQHANTSPNQYRYVGPGKEKDLGTPPNEEEFQRNKVGRPEGISLEEACSFYRQKKEGKRSTSEIEEEAGVKWDSIYKRLRREGLLEVQKAKVAGKETGCPEKTDCKPGQINTIGQIWLSTKA